MTRSPNHAARTIRPDTLTVPPVHRPHARPPAGATAGGVGKPPAGGQTGSTGSTGIGARATGAAGSGGGAAAGGRAGSGGGVGPGGNGSVVAAPPGVPS